MLNMISKISDLFPLYVFIVSIHGYGFPFFFQF